MGDKTYRWVVVSLLTLIALGVWFRPAPGFHPTPEEQFVTDYEAWKLLRAEGIDSFDQIERAADKLHASRTAAYGKD